MSVIRRKALPFAKNYRVSDPNLPLAFLYFGPNAWSAKKDMGITDRAIILPPYEAPQDYDWRFLRDQIVVAKALGVTEEKYRRRLAYEILKAGAERVHMFLPKQHATITVGQYSIPDEIIPHECYIQ